MKELLNSLNWDEVIVTIWTVILLPVLTYIGNEIKKYTEAKKIDKYTEILQKNVLSVVKDVYETEVKGVKGTDAWTEDKKEEVRQIAKSRIIFALSTSAFECLKAANADFDEYLDSLIESSLFDFKNK